MTWIDVQERLPKEFEQVLCFDKSHSSISMGRLIGAKERKMLKKVFKKKYKKILFDSADWFFPSDSITHWMPLPKQPTL